jgi:hypothetical protein
MSITGYKRLTVLLAVVVVVLLGLVLHFTMKFQIQRWNERDTWSAIRDFDMRRDAALRAEPKGAVEFLDTIVQLPPRQGTNALGRMIEHERAIAVRDVIDYLRKKTGEDLGDDPAKWISKYEK